MSIYIRCCGNKVMMIWPNDRPFPFPFSALKREKSLKKKKFLADWFYRRILGVRGGCTGWRGEGWKGREEGGEVVRS